MNRGELTDRQWERLRPLLPPQKAWTGRPAKDLPVNTLKLPAGFKIEVWTDGVPEARSLAQGEKGTVFASNRNAKSVYAITDRGGKREVKEILKDQDAPNGNGVPKPLRPSSLRQPLPRSSLRVLPCRSRIKPLRPSTARISAARRSSTPPSPGRWC